MNVDTTKKFNHISLCTGYGGLDLGLARVIKGLRAIAYCEIELYAIENLIDKMEKGIIAPAPIWSNLKTFPFKDFCGSVDILSGGFPCQPFSNAGRRDGDTDPRHLFPYIKQGIIDSRPAFVLLENVRGLISSKLQSDGWNDPKETSVLLHVLREMERIGYECHWGIFSARETGLPHLRQRVFILGKRADIDASRLEEFSKYFQNCDERTKWNGATFNIFQRGWQENTHEGNGRIDNPTLLLQKITESAFSAERIQSSSICTPSGRDREQQFYEPPRTLRKDMGNAKHQRNTDDHDTGTNRRASIDDAGFGGSQGQENGYVNASSDNERILQFSEDLGNTNEKGLQGYNLHTGSIDEQTRQGTPRFNGNASPTIQHKQGFDELVDAKKDGFQTNYLFSGSLSNIHSERTSRIYANSSPTIGHKQGFDELGNTGEGRSGILHEESELYSKTIRQRSSRYDGNASPTIEQIDIHRTTDDERTSTSETRNRENTGRDQPIELQRDVEPTMGRNVDGFTDWVDYERLCQSYTSIVDEIALLGNGVVPATAELAFRILFNKFL
jgi:DNA-cytosine methyltransferase